MPSVDRRACSALYRLLSLLLIWAAIAVCSGQALAADIDVTRTPTCDVRLTGEIEAGDADAVLVALKAVDRKTAPGQRLRHEWEHEHGVFVPRLCLDSGGGSFAEAISFIRATMKQVSFASVVEAGAECYSACALIFLGGHLNQGDGYIELYRRLHIAGKLGFHAPYISATAPGASDKLLSASYRAGVTAVSELLNLDGKLFPRSLLTEFLKAGPDEFFQLERVGHVAAGGIVLTGYARPTAIHEGQIANVCINQRLADNADAYYATYFGDLFNEPEPGRGARIEVGSKVVQRGELGYEGVAGCTALLRIHEDVLFISADTVSGTAGEIVGPWPRSTFLSASAEAHVTGIDPDGYTPGFYTFPFNAKIADLPRAR